MASLLLALFSFPLFQHSLIYISQAALKLKIPSLLRATIMDVHTALHAWIIC